LSIADRMWRMQETEGVPVLTVGELAEFPCFYSRHSGFQSPLHAQDELAVVKIIGNYCPAI